MMTPAEQWLVENSSTISVAATGRLHIGETAWVLHKIADLGALGDGTRSFPHSVAVDMHDWARFRSLMHDHHWVVECGMFADAPRFRLLNAPHALYEPTLRELVSAALALGTS